MVRVCALISVALMGLCGAAMASSTDPSPARAERPSLSDLLLRGWGEGDLAFNSPKNSPDRLYGQDWKLIQVIPLTSPEACPAILKRVGQLADELADHEAGVTPDGQSRGHHYLPGVPDKPYVVRMEVQTRYSHELWGCTVTPKQEGLIGVSVAYPLMERQLRLGDND